MFCVTAVSKASSFESALKEMQELAVCGCFSKGERAHWRGQSVVKKKGEWSGKLGRRWRDRFQESEKLGPGKGWE